MLWSHQVQQRLRQTKVYFSLFASIPHNPFCWPILIALQNMIKGTVKTVFTYKYLPAVHLLHKPAWWNLACISFCSMRGDEASPGSSILGWWVARYACVGQKITGVQNCIPLEWCYKMSRTPNWYVCTNPPTNRMWNCRMPCPTKEIVRE
jgi:hypothetical protein